MTEHDPTRKPSETGWRKDTDREVSEAIETLARELHWKMEHLDPTDGPEWDKLSDREKGLYRFSVRWLLAHETEIYLAIGRPATTE